MAFLFQECPISGLYEIQPKVFGDARGCFLETYNRTDFENAGIKDTFVQDNYSESSKGVVRGLHFQKRYAQSKIVRAIQGRVWDVAVDLRKGSPTFGSYHGVMLDAEKHNEFYIPKGFAHGFMVLSDFAVFEYKCSDFYHPEDEGGIRWDDATIGISWNTFNSMAAPVLSAKDNKNPVFDRARDYFDIDGNWIGD